MTRLVSPVVFVWLAGAVAICVVCGCRSESASSASESEVGSAAAKSTPEEKFARIVESLRRAIDTNQASEPSGFVVQKENGHSRLSIDSRLSHELIPPTNEGEPYRATITVERHYTYSLLITGTESKDANQESSQQDQARSDIFADEGVDILDEDLVTAAPTRSTSPRTTPSGDLLKQRSEDDVRTYELVYKDGRWVLISELDPDTERSIQFAFDHALAAQ